MSIQSAFIGVGSKSKNVLLLAFNASPSDVPSRALASWQKVSGCGEVVPDSEEVVGVNVVRDPAGLGTG